MPVPNAPARGAPQQLRRDRPTGGDRKLNRLIDSGPFEVHVARTFPLDQAAEAHRALGEHFLGKITLRPS